MTLDRLLSVENLSVTLNKKKQSIGVVRGVSFYLKRGETLAIVGESGCGKSMTVKAIMQLNPRGKKSISRDSKICFKGVDLMELRERDLNRIRGAQIAMIFQNPSTCLDPTMKIGSQIVETMRIHKKIGKKDARKRAIGLLEEVGISYPEDRLGQYPHELSGGMLQRVMIAMALSCEPSILIADEPTTALDVTTQAKILSLLKDIQKNRGMSIIFVTHDLGVAWEMADRIQVMYAGEVVEIGKKEDIFNKPSHPYTRALMASVPHINLDKSQRLYSLEGTPPSLANKISHCSFAPRCENCMVICKKVKPNKGTVGTGHLSYCWLNHPLARLQDGL